MSHAPFKDGQFLIEIGKQCKNLQKLSLRNNVRSPSASCDKVALFEMLECCRNLRDFTMYQFDLDQAEIFAALTKSVELEKVKLTLFDIKHSAAPWILSLENMIRQCVKLTTIICDTSFKTKDDFNDAVSAVERIEGELRRPDFQIRMALHKGNPFHIDGDSALIGSAVEELPQNEPFSY